MKGAGDLPPERQYVRLGKGCPHGNHGQRLKGQPASPPPGQTRAGPTSPCRWARTARSQPGRRARRPERGVEASEPGGARARVIILLAQEVAGAAHTPRALRRLPAAPTKAQPALRVARRPGAAAAAARAIAPPPARRAQWSRRAAHAYA
ncbi:hypothetical protein GH733_013783 [Mirounga leonina]|nr:hypothetical protein GH733_013783 [Mirounga leonina]